MKRHPNEPRCYNFRVVRGPLRLLLALSAFALLVPAAASAYGWPIRPFYQQHPIRGYFNDPRLSGDETGLPLRRRHLGSGRDAGLRDRARASVRVARSDGLGLPEARRSPALLLARRAGRRQGPARSPAPADRARRRRRGPRAPRRVQGRHVHQPAAPRRARAVHRRHGAADPEPDLPLVGAAHPARGRDGNGRHHRRGVRHAAGADPAALEPGDLHAVPDPLADRPGPEHDQAVGDAGRLPDVPPPAQPLQLRLRAGDVPEQGRSARALRVLPRAPVRHARAANGSYVLQVDALDEQENVGQASFAFTVTNAG